MPKRWKKLTHAAQIAGGARTAADGSIITYADGIGLDLTPYNLRHTFATMLCENDVPIKVAQKLMGHADASMIMKIYAHASEELERQAAAKMKDMFSGNSFQSVSAECLPSVCPKG